MKPKLLKNTSFFGTFLYDQAISKDHPFRFLLNTMNWDQIRKELQKDLAGKNIKYSHTGSPAIDPVIIFKLMILQRWHPASDRKVIERAKTDISYRYFLNLPIPMKIPDYSNLSKCRRLWGPEKLKKLFNIFFKQIQNLGFADVSKGIAGDITHGHLRIQSLTARNLLLECFRKYLLKLNKLTLISTNQNCIIEGESILSTFSEWILLHKAKIKANDLTREERFSEVVVMITETREKVINYLETLTEKLDINLKEYIEFQVISDLLDQILLENTTYLQEGDEQNSDTNGKNNSRSIQEPSTIQKDNNVKFKQKRGERKVVSIVDPEVRIGCKHKSKYFIGPKISTVMTTDGFIASINALSGNTADNTQGIAMLEDTIASSEQIPEVAAFDRGFNTLEIRKFCHDHDIQPGIEFEKTINKRNKGLYTAEDFIFDPINISVTCPNQMTSFKFNKNWNNESRVFRFNKKDCESCSMLQNCTTSKTGRTLAISRHKAVLDADKEFLKTHNYEFFRCLRWQKEAWYGWAKREFKLDDIPYYGINNSKVHVLLTGITVNLRKVYRYLTNKIKISSEVTLPKGHSVLC